MCPRDDSEAVAGNRSSSLVWLGSPGPAKCVWTAPETTNRGELGRTRPQQAPPKEGGGDARQSQAVCINHIFFVSLHSQRRARGGISRKSPRTSLRTASSVGDAIGCDIQAVVSGRILASVIIRHSFISPHLTVLSIHSHRTREK